MEETVASDRGFRWKPHDLLKLFLYFGCLFVAVTKLPNNIWDPLAGHVIVAIGVIGIWRYAWWTTHFIRSRIYGKVVFPKRRRQAEALWRSGWRPGHVYFLLTVFKERRATLRRVLESIGRECREVGVPATLYVGSAERPDEEIIEEYMQLQGRDLPLDVVIVRQNQPGKRFAMGLVLRAMSRRFVGGDDPVIFMDSDSILTPGCLRKCMPLFPLDAEVQALTTDEKPLLIGPKWMHIWLALRFAQRHLVMQSHALSRKVLTLTGRMSMFRASKVCQLEFIRLVEADALDHWLWGEFRFLSGDDKSTWYWLLRDGADMAYVPDALVWTIDYVEGGAGERMRQNLLRWSGNLLRSGARALRLGPRRLGFFIWWCLVDQRLAIWTALVGLSAVLTLAFWLTPSYIVAFAVWVAATRMLLSLVMFPHAGGVFLSFPLVMYLNQLLLAAVKIYIIFRLPKQRWAHRGDQRAYFESGASWRLKQAMAAYLTTLYVLAFFFFVMVYVGFLSPPGIPLFRLLFGP